MKTNRRGFTIVELLIVIVVIAILAAITIVAYNGLQGRARDAQRHEDIKTIAKALELYYADNGRYPSSDCSPNCPANKKINYAWSTTADDSWSLLKAQLVPKYISALPQDPQASVANNAGIYLGSNYDYISGTGWCNSPSGKQDYLLAYDVENTAQERTIVGDCSSGTQPTNYSGSEYYTRK